MVNEGQIAGCTKMYCEKKSKAYCASYLPSNEQVVDDGCVSWFDGCNNCIVMDNGGLACTGMYCEEALDKPYCLQYGKD